MKSEARDGVGLESSKVFNLEERLASMSMKAEHGHSTMVLTVKE
jgi:hypothetical protein